MSKFVITPRGERIEVETLNPEPPTRKRRNSFAQLDLEKTALAYKALGCRKAILWVWLCHRAWLRRSRTIAVPSAELAELGVHRHVKRRGLDQLAAVGLISIDERSSRKAPIVTLL